MICGLLGHHLSHSYSPAIHGHLGSYEYRLFEKEPEELEAFFCSGEFTGLNVTMPYKKAVIPYLDSLSEQARLLGAVNTIVRQEDGSLWGHNTDYFGFQYLLAESQLEVHGKKVLVLGSGGASNTVCAVLRQQGARVVVISRNGENHYSNLENHRDTFLIVNTTPVGMYPDTGSSAVGLSLFPHLAGVLDLIYNPARTRLVLEARARGLVALGGLSMLVAQAWESSQCFTGTSLPLNLIPQIRRRLQLQAENLILIGMPGCGKSTLGPLVAARLRRPLADVDACIEEKTGMTIPELFATHGQSHFRDLETAELEELGKQSGLVIACGGGVVTEMRNLPLLRQNGRIFWIQRPLSALATQGRPLSQGDLQALYEVRTPLYQQFSDTSIENSGSLSAVADQIQKKWEECP